jgi:nitroimidazol reductase NimA-like FMN-containing flavoprotein (pyridoxamine 5'-phosphate oxidase superfamily)
MTESETLEILHFLNANPMGVISTIHKDTGTPESALIAFAETPIFELIFQTLNTSRKYLNLKQNPHISFVTGWEIDKPHQITFQYEGRAREIPIEIIEIHLSRRKHRASLSS